jgi:hypothetical protein
LAYWTEGVRENQLRITDAIETGFTTIISLPPRAFVSRCTPLSAFIQEFVNKKGRFENLFIK